MTRGQAPWLVALLLAVVLPHYAYQWAAATFGSSEARWHYVLSGAGGVLVFVAMAAMWRRVVPQLVCLWGVAENGLKSGCGFARLHEIVFAPGGYVCQGGERLTMIGAWVALLLAMGVLYAAKAAGPR
jgi:hypothetical protein